MSNKPKVTGKPIDPVFKFKMEHEFHRTFTWKERLQILIGYGARLKFRCVMLHNPGRHEAALILTTTKELKPKGPAYAKNV